MDLEKREICDFDHLKVYDGRNAQSPLLGTFCGGRRGVITSYGRALFVTFTTDDFATGSGFNVTISYKSINSNKG